ncbi:hypothetical protein MIC448_2570001 [Microbacterium sp. C448]|nr:hypothetical protein [Microbacterium sp. C448]CDK00495.1 hypothetical protein MIC448_2570001 [Microbacterium sp. C448]
MVIADKDWIAERLAEVAVDAAARGIRVTVTVAQSTVTLNDGTPDE